MTISRKEQIIEEAIAAVADLGFKRTNARSVAARLGIRPSNVFYYFKTEQDLVMAMLGKIVSTNQLIVESYSASRPGNNVLQKLSGYLIGNLNWAFTYRSQVTVLLYGISEGQSDRRLLELVSKALDTGEQKIYNLLAVGIAEQEFSLIEGFNLHQAAASLHQILIGLIVRSISESGANLQEYMTRMLAMVQVLILSNGTSYGS